MGILVTPKIKIMIQIDPELLDWYIKNEEKNMNEAWWPLFIHGLKTGNKIPDLIDSIYKRLEEDVGVACFETGKTFEIEPFNRKFAEAIVEGYKKYFLKEEPVDE